MNRGKKKRLVRLYVGPIVRQPLPLYEFLIEKDDTKKQYKAIDE